MEKSGTNAAQVEQKRFSPGLTLLDADAIERTLPNVARLGVETVIETSVMRAALQRTTKLIGIDSAYYGVVSMSIAEGGNFTPTHFRLSAPVCIIGHSVKARFFPNESPIGKTIKCGSSWLTVVGVLKERFVNAQTLQRLGIRNVNMDVYVPITTMLLRYRNRAFVTQEDIRLASQNEDEDAKNKESNDETRNYHQLDRIIVQMTSSAYSANAAEALSRMLKRRHNDVIDIEIIVPELLLEQEKRTKSIFNIVLGAIASISLIVGGIGIMNILKKFENCRYSSPQRSTIPCLQHFYLYNFYPFRVYHASVGIGAHSGNRSAPCLGRYAARYHDAVFERSGNY